MPSAVKLIGVWCQDVVMYSKQLDDGNLAIGLFNMSEDKRVARVNLDEVGLPFSTGKTLAMEEVWTGEKIKVTNSHIQKELAPFDCAVYIAKDGRPVSLQQRERQRLQHLR